MDNRNNRSGGQQRQAAGGNGQRQQPWNVLRVKETTDGEGRVSTDFQPCGVAWPAKEGEGLNVDVHFALPEGTRLVIRPRKAANNGGGR